MKQTFKGWQSVASELTKMAGKSAESVRTLNAGQRASLKAIADRIVKNGVILADEVGMGKTRIAVFVAKSSKICLYSNTAVLTSGLLDITHSRIEDSS